MQTPNPFPWQCSISKSCLCRVQQAQTSPPNMHQLSLMLSSPPGSPGLLQCCVCRASQSSSCCRFPQPWGSIPRHRGGHHTRGWAVPNTVSPVCSSSHSLMTHLKYKKKKPTYSLVGIYAGKLYCPIMALPRIFLILFVVPIGTISVGKSIICKINLEDMNRQMNNAFVLWKYNLYN